MANQHNQYVLLDQRPGLSKEQHGYSEFCLMLFGLLRVVHLAGLSTESHTTNDLATFK